VNGNQDDASADNSNNFNSGSNGWASLDLGEEEKSPIGKDEQEIGKRRTSQLAYFLLLYMLILK
jgi:hypothetical protein